MVFVSDWLCSFYKQATEEGARKQHTFPELQAHGGGLDAFKPVLDLLKLKAVPSNPSIT